MIIKQSDFEKKIEELQKRIEELAKEVGDLEIRKENAINREKTANEMVKKLLEEKDKLEQELFLLDKAVLNKQAEKKVLEEGYLERISEKDNEIKKKQNLLESIDHNIDNTNILNSDLLDKNIMFKSDIEHLKETYDNLKKQREDLLSDLSDLKKERDQVLSEMIEKQNKNDKEREELDGKIHEIETRELFIKKNTKIIELVVQKKLGVKDFSIF